MGKANILLLGNTYADTVFTPASELEIDSTNVGGFSKRLGGVWNVARELEKHEVSLTVTAPRRAAHPQTNLSIIESDWAMEVETFIVEDAMKGTRTSYVQTPSTSVIPEFPTVGIYDVAHIAYFDQLTIRPLAWNQIRKASKFVSADLSLNHHTEEQVQDMYAMFEGLDVLFCSEIEWQSIESCLDDSQIRNIEKMSLTVVTHTPRRVIAIAKGETYDFRVDKLENVPVLGAGDRFAANFIMFKLIKGMALSDAVRESALVTGRSLKEDSYA